MAELADATDLKSVVRKDVGVQLPLGPFFMRGLHMQNKVLEVATRIYRKAYASISGRPDNAWQAKEGRYCVYNQKMNGGCAIGCNLPADFDASNYYDSITNIFYRCRLPALQETHKFINALGIPQELWGNHDLIDMLDSLQSAHDSSLTKETCLESIRFNAARFGIDLGLGA